ncbi:HNH endonuclease [Wenzhouxiangella sp. EGI_FJ10305]|uniref:HNH endonuclease n=1 Tax=Wenzhouxiangella sp. EGI_FJ10305 TaxID=3243768 RepID=UPI0035DF6B2A
MGLRGPSRAVGKDRRWPALRLQALRRDGFQCVQCGIRVGLEVDHIKPVRDAPDRAFDLDNLQVLCGSCHSKKTRREMGFPELDGERLKWRNFLK